MEYWINLVLEMDFSAAVLLEVGTLQPREKTGADS